MKQNFFYLVILMLASAAGVVIGEAFNYFVFPHQAQANHVCTCEYCKLTRQLETIEVLDSILKEE